MSSAHARLQRGYEHLNTLKQEIARWDSADAHGFELENDPNALGYSWYGILRVNREPDLVRWSVLFSDAVHNFRAALDHAVYALGVAHSGPLARTTARGLQFPICDTRAKFVEQRWRIEPLAPQARAEVERLQPLERIRRGLNSTLAWLRDYDDIGKHRLLHTATALPRHSRATPARPIRGPYKITYANDPRMEDRTRFLRIQTANLHLHMSVDFELSLEIGVEKAWEDDPSRPINLPLMRILFGMLHATRHALGELDRFAS